MKFTGYGVVWNPKAKKVMVNFKETPEYDTNDPYEIDILSSCGSVSTDESVVDTTTCETIEPDPRTRKQLVKDAKEAGIKGADRMSKEEMIKLLEV